MPASAVPTELALVTGASRRIGREIALELARHGFAIGLHYHASRSAAQETAAELQQLGAEVELLPADLADPAQVTAMFAHLDGIPYRLRILVNSAATMARGNLREMTVEDWDATLALNLRAPWLCAREAAHRMDPGGVIINVTDSGARKTWSGYPAYVLSKSALETLTRLLARSLAPGIRVNAVAPGLILPPPDLREEEWLRLVERLPLKERGSPRDVASAVWFLVENEHITGETIVVDGGYQLI